MTLQPQPPKRCWQLPFCNRCKQHQRFLFKHGPVMILAHRNIIRNPSKSQFLLKCHLSPPIRKHNSSCCMLELQRENRGITPLAKGNCHVNKTRRFRNPAMYPHGHLSKTQDCLKRKLFNVFLDLSVGYISDFFLRPPGSLLGWATASRLRVCSKDRTISCFVARGS